MLTLELPDEIDINLCDLCQFFEDRGYKLFSCDEVPGVLVPIRKTVHVKTPELNRQDFFNYYHEKIAYNINETLNLFRKIKSPACPKLTLIQGGKDGN